MRRRGGNTKKVYDDDEDVKIRNAMEKLGRQHITHIQNSVAMPLHYSYRVFEPNISYTLRS